MLKNLRLLIKIKKTCSKDTWNVLRMQEKCTFVGRNNSRTCNYPHRTIIHFSESPFEKKNTNRQSFTHSFFCVDFFVVVGWLGFFSLISLFLGDGAFCLISLQLYVPIYLLWFFPYKYGYIIFWSYFSLAAKFKPQNINVAFLISVKVGTFPPESLQQYWYTAAPSTIKKRSAPFVEESLQLFWSTQLLCGLLFHCLLSDDFQCMTSATSASI